MSDYIKLPRGASVTTTNVGEPKTWTHMDVAHAQAQAEDAKAVAVSVDAFAEFDAAERRAKECDMSFFWGVVACVVSVLFGWKGALVFVLLLGLTSYALWRDAGRKLDAYRRKRDAK